MKSKIVCIKKRTTYILSAVVFVVVALGIISYAVSSRSTSLFSRAAPSQVNFGGMGEKCHPETGSGATLNQNGTFTKPCDVARSHLYCDLSLDYLL